MFPLGVFTGGSRGARITAEPPAPKMLPWKMPGSRNWPKRNKIESKVDACPPRPRLSEGIGHLTNVEIVQMSDVSMIWMWYALIGQIVTVGQPSSRTDFTWPCVSRTSHTI